MKRTEKIDRMQTKMKCESRPHRAWSWIQHHFASLFRVHSRILAFLDADGKRLIVPPSVQQSSYPIALALFERAAWFANALSSRSRMHLPCNASLVAEKSCQLKESRHALEPA